MTVEANQAFRRDLREKAGGATFQVIHNRTVRIALEKAFYGDEPEVLDEMLKGPSAIVFGGDGPIPIAKVLREWKRKFKSLRVKGGVSEGEVLGAGRRRRPGGPAQWRRAASHAAVDRSGTCPRNRGVHRLRCTAASLVPSKCAVDAGRGRRRWWTGWRLAPRAPRVSEPRRKGVSNHVRASRTERTAR